MTHDLPDVCIELSCLLSALSSELVLHVDCAICVQSFFQVRESGFAKGRRSQIVCKCQARNIVIQTTSCRIGATSADSCQVVKFK